MDQIKDDIARELSITDNLTKLSSKIGLLLQRYSELEVGLIELVRMDHNTKSVRIETPADINEEVKNILTAMRKKQPQQQLSDRPRTPKKLRISTNTSMGMKEPHPVAGSKLLMSQSYNITDLSNVTTERQERPRTPAYPEVQLLNDPRSAETHEKLIGFRPSWKCEA
ncbi:uncharacterized protein LOC114941116 isoform X2 [Nylanderia fulva]|nr:uncharacterized protein LOC114941116 isoform X2 [Nylanderia fulva]